MRYGIERGETSLAQRVAALSESDRDDILDGMDPEALAYDPQFWLRPTQLRPINEEDWQLCVFAAGRGSGKTRTMMEWVREKSKRMPGSRGAFVARTAADARDVLVRGDSGILAVSPPSERPEYEPSKRLLTWPNGTTALLFSSEAPDQLRGPQFAWSACIAEGTLIATDRGEVSVEDVRYGDRVLVRDGRYLPVRSDSVRTRVRADVLRLATESGRELVLTPDHRVWVEGRGWVNACDLRVGDPVLELWTQNLVPHLDGSSTAEIAGTCGSGTTTMPTDEENFSIVASGPTLTVRSQTGMSSTTSTTTRRTTSSRISLSWRARNIVAIMRSLARTVSGSSSRSEIPEAQLLAPCGCADENQVLRSTSVSSAATSSGVSACDLCSAAPSAVTTTSPPNTATTRVPGLIVTGQSRLSASCAVRTSPPIRLERSTARTDASAGSSGKTRRLPAHANRKHVFARTVDRATTPVVGETPSTVPVTVRPSTIVRISDSSPVDVYDISVDGDRHEFFAGNLLVHNCDEVASWKYLPDDSGLNAWDNVRLATRLGDQPQIFAATTPKRTPFMRQLLTAAEEEDHVLLLRGRTTDNAGNLAQSYLDTIYGLYRGTALARQELDGEMLDDLEGALWREEEIDGSRLSDMPHLRRPFVVVGVDPTVSESPGDEVGIVVVAADGAIRDLYRREAYVLEDVSLQAAPGVWAPIVVETARRWGAPIIAETNQGGALIKSVLTGVDPTVRVLEVHSKYGKALRAEPVVLAYQQGRVHHVGYFPDLESQQCTWVPDETRKSPDRIDALVQAVTALLVKPPEGLLGGTVRAISPNRRASLPPAPRPGAILSTSSTVRRGARVY